MNILAEMNILADENIDEQIIETLRKNGYNILYVGEMAPGISDEVVLSKANKMSAVLLTADKDFGELVFRQHLISKGVILVRLSGMSPNDKSKQILAVINEHKNEIINSFTVITHNHIRIRSIT